MRVKISGVAPIFFFLAVAAWNLAIPSVAWATIPALTCEGPLNGQSEAYDAANTNILGTLPYDMGPPPKSGQFFCSLDGGTPLPSTACTPGPGCVQYRCEETSTNGLFCRRPANPTTDYYTCKWLGTNPSNASGQYAGWVFDNCIQTILPAMPPVTGLQAIPISASQINFSWVASPSPAVAYEVHPDRPNGGGFILPIIITTATLLPYTNLFPNTTYGFWVLAVDIAGNKSGSNQYVTATTFSADTTPPTNPTSLSAAAISTSQINLSWGASTDAGGVAGYRIERCAGVGCAGFAQIATSPVAGYSDTGLTPATSYTYRVRAYDTAAPANLSGFSAQATAVTFTPVDTAPPSVAPVLSGTAISSSQINLSWTAAVDNVGIAAYEVFRDNASIAVVGSSVVTYNNPGLSPATAYVFRVEAVDAAGNRTASNSISLVTPAAPDAAPPIFTPTSPSATLPAGTQTATLGGTTNESATCRYSLLEGQAFTSMTLFSTTGGANHAHPLTELADNTAYAYFIKCRDGAGNTSADFGVLFSVSAPTVVPDTIPPVISNGQPAGILAVGTQTATLSVDTNEIAYCRYNQNTDIPFASMTGIMGSAATHHSAALTGLANGAAYQYFVRCQDDPAGNVSVAAISFSVASAPNILPTASFTVLPISGTAPLTVSVVGTANDADGTINNALTQWNWGSSSPVTTGTLSAVHTYTTPGTYGITLRVTDNQGGTSATLPFIVTVSSVPPPPPPPPATAGICIAACTRDEDCAGLNIICAPNGICALNVGFCTPGEFSCFNNTECPASGICPAPLIDNGSVTSLDGALVSSSVQPVTFPFGTTSVNMSVTTDVNATCQYAAIADTAYGASGANQFTPTGGLSHSVRLVGLGGADPAANNTHMYHIRCKDALSGNANIVDYDIAFSIGAAAFVSGPPGPYLCLVNQNFIRNNLPYFFDVCTPSCDSNADCAPPTPTCDIVKKICR